MLNYSLDATLDAGLMILLTVPRSESWYNPSSGLALLASQRKIEKKEANKTTDQI